MQLRPMQPKEGVDLVALQAALAGGWKQGLPQALSDEMLVSLAHDFRKVETHLIAEGTVSDDLPSLAPTMFVVFNILLKHPRHKVHPVKGLQVEHRMLLRALQIYQWSVEREVVSRICDVSILKDTDALLEALWEAASA